MFRPKPEPPPAYKYFDTPDGNDVDKKLLVVTKPALGAALAAGTADVLMYSHPTTYTGYITRYAAVGGPILAASTAFVVTSNVSASIRGKDDKFNWFLGGASIGPIVGAVQRSVPGGAFATLALGGIAVLCKWAHQNGVPIFPTREDLRNQGARYNGNPFWLKADLSLMEERPANWVKSK